MVTWSVTIPTFYAVTVHVMRLGVFGRSPGLLRVSGQLMTWVPLATIVSYGIIIIVAQLAPTRALTNIFGL